MLRGFITFALDYPIINHILMVFIVLLSLFSYQKVAKEIFPSSTLDQISISGGYVGASADVLDKMVVHTIEDQLKSLAQIDTIYATIQNGGFSVSADIKEGNDVQLVLSDVKDILSSVRRDLPADMDEPIAKVAKHNFPLILVAVSGDVEKRRLIEVANKLKSRLALIQGLSDIEVRGDTDDEVLIEIDQKKIEAFGLQKRSVYQAISGLSSIFPAGTLDGKGEHLYISTINGEKSEETLQRTLLSIEGKRLRLGDIANVRYGLGDPFQISHFNGKENISLNINKTKYGNAIALSKEIREELKEFQKEYTDIVFSPYTDTSVWIKNRLNLVSSNILFGLVLVFIALLLTVNYRIAMVVVIGIPTSFFITLVAMDLIDYSLNMLTLLGALIALGMLVDEAIVVAENIYRHMEMGKDPKTAAIDGASEMFPAVITATFTTVFAFLPLLLMSGKMGMFMQVLPIMITVLLLASLFEAFYFLPLHAKELFSLGEREQVSHAPKGVWKGVGERYSRFMLKTLERKKRSLLKLVGFIVVGTGLLFTITKFQLFPQFDAQQIYLNGKVNINNSLEDTEVYVTQIEEQLLAMLDKNETDSVTSVIGFKFNADRSFEVGENLFQIFINLHEKKPDNFFDVYISPIFSLEYDDSNMRRGRDSFEIAKEVEEKLVPHFSHFKDKQGSKIFEEFNVYVQQTGVVGNDIEIGLSTVDTPKLMAGLMRIEQNLSAIEGVSDIANNANEGEKELKLRVNEYGQRLGFSEGYIISTLQGSFLKAEYAKMFNSKGLVRVKIEDTFKKSASHIASFKLTSPDGRVVVRLDEVCDFMYQKSFIKIFKEDGEKVYSVYAKVDKKQITPMEVMEQLRPLLNKLESEGVKLVIKGEEKENKKLKQEMSMAAMIAMFLIFLTLVAMFNSLVLPLIILSTIPLSIFGALLGTKLMGINLTMPGMMGIIGLAGVVVNDGLIVLSFIRNSKTYKEVVQRASLRLRPVILTSVTTILGLFTLMFFASGQAKILQPMAISLGYGIAWATVLNLIYVPLMYAVIYGVKR
jgi:HAE1 family hydrophobic/amphiphilic exporter-1